MLAQPGVMFARKVAQGAIWPAVIGAFGLLVALQSQRGQLQNAVHLPFADGAWRGVFIGFYRANIYVRVMHNASILPMSDAFSITCNARARQAQKKCAASGALCREIKSL